ncbi:hypothetical protein D3C72_1550170 [compost metagenome]
MSPSPGRLKLIQPNTSPLSSAPPPLPSEIGIPYTVTDSMPTSRPSRIPTQRKTRSVVSTWRTAVPSSCAAALSAGSVPTRVRRSPCSSCVAGVIGRLMPERTICCTQTKRRCRCVAIRARSPSVRPLRPGLLTITWRSSSWSTSWWADGGNTSTPTRSPALTSRSRTPIRATMSPASIFWSGSAERDSLPRNRPATRVRPPIWRSSWPTVSPAAPSAR